MSTMIKVLAMSVLGLYLMFALLYLDRPRLLLKPGHHERTTHRVLGEPIAVLLAGPFLATPMTLLLPEERAQLSHSTVKMALVIVAFPLAYWLVKLLSPPRHKPRRLVLAIKAVGLVTAVVATEMLALEVNVPVLSVAGPLVVLAIVAATTYLACVRLADFSYWPTRLVRLGWEYLAAVAAIIGLTVWAGGQIIPDPRASGGLTQFVALLELAALVVACTATVVGYVRRNRWLLSGPPAKPAPPGVTSWPPEEGEVWLAIITHDDAQETHKERRVLVWDATPTHVEVLTVTTQPKHGDDRYLSLPLAKWQPVLTKDGWLSLEPRPVPYSDFLKFIGHCPVKGMGDKLDGLVRKRNKHWPGFALRHMRASAKNQHVGPHQDATPADYRHKSRSRS